MEQIIKTTLLEYEKSTFLIDLVQHDSGQLYINIQQTIHQDDKFSQQQEIKINPSILTDILEVLNSYQKQIPKQQFNRKGHLTEDDKNAIQQRYLKGVSIDDLTIQFDCSAELIEQILNNKGIAIVSNKPPKTIKKFRRRRRY